MQCAKKEQWTQNTHYNKVSEQLFIEIYMNLPTSFTKRNRYRQKYGNTNYSVSN